MTERARDALLVAGLGAAALALRLAGFAEGDFWVDELETLRVVDRSPAEVLIAVQENEGAPHLYYVLAWAWSGVLGVGEAGIRSLSAIAGALVAPLAYLTLRRVDLRIEALIAAGIAAASPILVWYSQEARVYSLFALVTAATLFFFVRTLVNLDRRALVGWSIASVAALLTHYFAVFTIAGMSAALLYRHRARWRWIALSLTPVAAAAFAVLPTVAFQRSEGSQRWIAEVPLQERLLQVPEHFLTGFTYPPLAVVLGAALIAVTGAIGLLIHDRRGQLVGVTLLGVGAASIVLPTLLAVASTDLLNSRNMLGALIPLILAIGVGLGAARLRPAGPIMAVALVCLLVVMTVVGEYDHDVERPAWSAAAQAVAEGGDPDLVIACCGAVALPAQHYFAGFEPYDPDPIGDVEVKDVVLATIQRPDRRPDNDFCWWGGSCLASSGGDPGGPEIDYRAVPRALSSIFERVDAFRRGSITLERYRAATPVSLRRARRHFRLRSRTPSAFPTFTAVVNAAVSIPGVAVLIRER